MAGGTRRGHVPIRWSGLPYGVLMLVCCLAPPASATDHFNLESGIPITLEDITPTDRGQVEFHAFGSSSWTRGEAPNGAATPRLALGIWRETQLEIAAPLLLGEGTAHGNGDPQLSVLRRVLDDSGHPGRPGFAIEADLTLPTGAEIRGFTNRPDAGLTALVRMGLGSQAVHLNAGLEWSGDESDDETIRKRAWSGAVGHHTPLSPRLVLVSDVARRQADDEHAPDTWLLETGVRAQLAREVIGAAGLAAGLDRGPETPAWSLTIGVQIGL
jgi:outer membrane putative beta-barrel porin/alpha-amylase